MKIMPDEYQSLKLTRTEKIFVRYAQAYEGYGYMLLNENPSMRDGEKQHIIICDRGVIAVKLWENISSPEMFDTTMSMYYASVFSEVEENIYERLLENKIFKDKSGKLRFEFNYVCVFPDMNKVDSFTSSDAYAFAEQHCLFKEDMKEMKRDFSTFISKSFDMSPHRPGDDSITITDENINAVLNRLAVEYTISRIVRLDEEDDYTGVDNSNLVIDDEDRAVRAYGLDADQINMVNKISKGDQLILACAGSGKSVLLIAKCFKAASMNPTRKFLITCYNTKLMSLYKWYIDRAGFRERNVECYSFHKLMKVLAEKNNLYLKGKPEEWDDIFAEWMRRGLINTRYYGIFIDEIQTFDQTWYKICYNLLENKNSDDHIFVICGDKTQDIKNKQKHGQAPWNVGEGYPNYRGGNKSLRIEKNYRNCIEINEYINRYATNAKKILSEISDNDIIDPDLFLRGKARRHGEGVFLKRLEKHNSWCEGRTVVDAVKEAHDHYLIPYNEIAIVIFRRRYNRRMKGWDGHYNIETPLLSIMQDVKIPHSVLYNDENTYGSNYQDYEGVALISFESVLGLDFRAVIVCGMKPLGDYEHTKTLTEEKIHDESLEEKQISEIEESISQLYVSCTRARDLLYIVVPERPEESVYVKMLTDAYEEKRTVES